MFRQLATLFALAIAISAIPVPLFNSDPQCEHPTRTFTKDELDAVTKTIKSGKYRNYEEVVLALKDVSPSAYELLKEEELRFENDVQKLGKEAEEFARKARGVQIQAISIMIFGGFPTAEGQRLGLNLAAEYKALSDDAKAQLKASPCLGLPSIEKLPVITF